MLLCNQPPSHTYTCTFVPFPKDCLLIGSSIFFVFARTSHNIIIIGVWSCAFGFWAHLFTRPAEGKNLERRREMGEGELVDLHITHMERGWRSSSGADVDLHMHQRAARVEVRGAMRRPVVPLRHATARRPHARGGLSNEDNGQSLSLWHVVCCWLLTRSREV